MGLSVSQYFKLLGAFAMSVAMVTGYNSRVKVGMREVGGGVLMGGQLIPSHSQTPSSSFQTLCVFFLLCCFILYVW